MMKAVRDVESIDDVDATVALTSALARVLSPSLKEDDQTAVSVAILDPSLFPDGYHSFENATILGDASPSSSSSHVLIRANWGHPSKELKRAQFQEMRLWHNQFAEMETIGREDMKLFM